eukprot:UN03051
MSTNNNKKKKNENDNQEKQEQQQHEFDQQDHPYYQSPEYTTYKQLFSFLDDPALAIRPSSIQTDDGDEKNSSTINKNDKDSLIINLPQHNDDNDTITQSTNQDQIQTSNTIEAMLATRLFDVLF